MRYTNMKHAYGYHQPLLEVDTGYVVLAADPSLRPKRLSYEQ